MFWAAEIFFLNQKLCPTPGALSGSRGCRFEHYLQHLICFFFSLSPIFCRLVGSFKTFTIFQVGCALLARQRHQVVLSYHLSTPGFWYLYLLTFYICIICIICIVSYVSYVPSINTRYICICPNLISNIFVHSWLGDGSIHSFLQRVWCILWWKNKHTILNAGWVYSMMIF